MNKNMDISVIVPLYNEDESIGELTSWIENVMQTHNYSYEIIMIDDGSNDNSWKVIEELSLKNTCIKGIKFRRNYGKSAALNVGFEASKGNVVITMDADLQDSPDEIPGLYRMITDEKFDIVSGWKKKRYDPIMKTIPSKFFNWTTRKMSGIKLNDFNCGLKAYKSEVVKSIEVYGEMHRYIPVIAKWSGFSKIGEKIVVHRERKYGVTKFGLDRFVKGYLDLISISFVSKFGKRPMHFFGLIGTLIFIIGFSSAFWLGAEKLLSIYKGVRAPLVTSSPYFYIAIASMIIGVQLFLAGFLAEMIGRSSPSRNSYLIEKRTENQ